MLYMLEIMQAITFFNRFPNERITVKLTVAAALFVDTLGTMDNCACIYLVSSTGGPCSVYPDYLSYFLLVCHHSLGYVAVLFLPASDCCSLPVGDMSYVVNQNWAVPTYVILSGVSAVITQLFLSWRYWQLYVPIVHYSLRIG
jgi:hypothetical protein